MLCRLVVEDESLSHGFQWQDRFVTHIFQREARLDARDACDGASTIARVCRTLFAF